MQLVRYVLLVLAALLPVQNALIHLMVNRLGLPESLGFWKEGLGLLLLLYFLAAIGRFILAAKGRLQPSFWYRLWPLVAVALATGVIVVSSFAYNQIALGNFLIGFRFELWWLWLFAVTVTWYWTVGHVTAQPELKKFLQIGIDIGFVLVSVITLASWYFGQPAVASVWNAPAGAATQYLVRAPDCHLVDYHVDGCRVSGPFSTPNHLTGYLLLVLPLFLTNLLNAAWHNRLWSSWRGYYDLGAVGLIAVFIGLSFSRFAWLSLAVFGVFLTMLLIYKFWPGRLGSAVGIKLGLSLVLLIPFLIAAVAVNLPEEVLTNSWLPTAVTKPSSTSLHARHFRASWQILTTNPQRLGLGYGLPSSGPAAKEPFLNEYANPMLVANSHIAYQHGLIAPDLAIPENWFLQVLLNGGLVYLLLYTLVVLIPLWPFVQSIGRLAPETRLVAKWLVYGLGFFGVILGNLLLHIWENQTVAVYWTLVWLYYQLEFRQEPNI